jgi:hypothetical protein
MGKNSELTDIGSFTKPTFDPLVLKAYSEALKQKQKWRTSIDQLIRDTLGLKEDQPLNPGMIPSAEEIRREMNRYIPETEKLSDLIIAMREE